MPLRVVKLPIIINLRSFEKTMILDFEVVEDSPY